MKHWFALGLGALLGCSAHGVGFDDKDGATQDGGLVGEGGILGGQDGASGDGGAGVSVIYAHTDNELYSMDPGTHAVTDIGPFDDGTASTPNITDLAVNSAGEVWVNSETIIYRASVPNGTGPVKLTKVANIALKTNQKFYALGFAPAGVLGQGETLVAGDNLGELYAIETNGSTTPLGNFGTDGSGGTYELSGDVMFYVQNGKARGLATVRLFKNNMTSNDDILAEIDVAAMQTAYMTKTSKVLKKQFLGGGTGFGKLYGVGAWNDSVYAFSRTSNGTPAELVQINGSGVGKSLQKFGAITAGWSGAGVTTSVNVTVLPPN